MDAICDDLDLLIVGGCFGSGRRANILSHFILALAIPPTQPGTEPTRFKSVCKVGSGYSMKELYDLNVHLNQTALMRTKPDWLELASERSDVYIDPKNSKILQVRIEFLPSFHHFSMMARFVDSSSGDHTDYGICGGIHVEIPASGENPRRQGMG